MILVDVSIEKDEKNEKISLWATAIRQELVPYSS